MDIKVIIMKKIFNIWTVIQVLHSNRIKNYWNRSGRYDEVKIIFNYDIDDVKENILELINGNEIEIKLANYGVVNIQNELENNEVEDIQGESENYEYLKEELYSKMVIFGYLTYCDRKIRKISIPNKELEEKSIYALTKRSDTQIFYDMIKNSNEILLSDIK